MVNANYILFILILLVVFIPSNKIETTGGVGDSESIILYGRISCPYTVKAIQRLKKDGLWDKVKFIDTESESGAKLFKTKKTSGVPYFENPSNDKSAVGFMETKELIKMLEL